jgi:hypothetical protein
MNITASRNNHHLLHWMAAVLLLTGCALAEAGIIAWCASFVTLWELGAIGFTYVLIALGLLFTVWQMREIGNRQILHL